jgi:hypothetical protein
VHSAKAHLRADIPRLKRRAALLNNAIFLPAVSAIVTTFLVIVAFAWLFALGLRAGGRRSPSDQLAVRDGGSVESQGVARCYLLKRVIIAALVPSRPSVNFLRPAARCPAGGLAVLLAWNVDDGGRAADWRDRATSAGKELWAKVGDGMKG